ncbi:MAG: 2-dehydropantoate 2-reductase [Thermoplasmata archaeon]|nr:2-dehydropantoate 2-reductase [Thermoplasmata archaeon]
MDLIVYGAGSVGSLIGGLLSQKENVILVARRPHVEAIRREGLRITGLTEKRNVVRASVSLDDALEDMPRPDAVLVCVKSYDLAEALEDIWVHAPLPVVLLQNGLAVLDTPAEVWAGGKEDIPPIAIASLTLGAFLEEPGVVRYTGHGTVTTGPHPLHATEQGSRESLRLAEKMAAVLGRAGVNTVVESDMETVVWRKTGVNLLINPVTALAGRENRIIVEMAGMPESPGAAVLRRLAEEFASAANAVLSDEREGRFTGEDVLRSALEVAENTGENRSSMLQDLERGRRTEADSIMGSLLEKARGAGVETLTVEMLHILVNLRAHGCNGKML